ncbi:MAG: serine hydrolase domain-containing protein, partial [Bacteroidota bacterium]
MSFRLKPLFSLSILLCLFVSFSWAQEKQVKRETVENGFALQVTIPSGQERVKENILKRLEKYKIPGASVAVVHNGKLDWSKSYGVTQIGSTDSVTTQTLFQCASIGKMITAIAALQLVDDGLIDLDEPVNNKLKQWKIPENEKTATKPVTLRHLLSHSAGLTDDYGFLGYGPKDEIPSPVQILNETSPAKKTKSMKIQYEPGTIERYSGGGYLIIQLLIEDLSIMSFEEYVLHHILSPLKMNQTTYAPKPEIKKNVSIALGHNGNGKPLKNKKYNIYPEHAAAGPWTTAEDLAKFIIGIQNAYHGKDSTLATPSLVKEMLIPQINTRGIGANLRGVERVEAFWHSGQNLGYTSLLYGLSNRWDG